ncbi:MAG: hypothetical protein GXO78_05995 [Calditrichaeota bacterium]|nr:hypothetical protein [Calditrichota bacterium]
MERFVKIVFFFAALVALSGFGQALIELIPPFLSRWKSNWPFLAGVGVYGLLWRIYLSRRAPFWSIVEHELTHAVFALLFFKRVRSLNAFRNRGGQVTVEGGNFVIALAPYIFPLPVLFIILLKFLIVPHYDDVLNFLLGFFLMFHLVPLFSEVHPSQPDIQTTGVIFSLVVILLGNLFFIGLTLSALEVRGAGIDAFLKAGWQMSLKNAQIFWQFIQQKLAHLL